MRLEEAKSNIGQEVELDESTKPYTWVDSDDGETYIHDDFSNVKRLTGKLKIVGKSEKNIVIRGSNGFAECFSPHHVKFKAENLKINIDNNRDSQIAEGYMKEINNVIGKEVGIKSVGVDLSKGDDKKEEGEFQNFELRKEMTWENALRAVAEGKEVEFYNTFHEQWWDISGLRISEITSGKKYRIAPQRITLNGEFTKEELLQKIGEME